MLYQLFRKQLPIDLLMNLLEHICLKTDKYYFIDLTAYKKLIFLDLHKEFIDTVKEFYHLSKRFYLEREFTYPSFTNIVRQICKHGNIKFESEVKYNRSQYFINFLIYYQ